MGEEVAKAKVIRKARRREKEIPRASRKAEMAIAGVALALILSVRIARTLQHHPRKILTLASMRERKPVVSTLISGKTALVQASAVATDI